MTLSRNRKRLSPLACRTHGSRLHLTVSCSPHARYVELSLPAHAVAESTATMPEMASAVSGFCRSIVAVDIHARHISGRKTQARLRASDLMQP